MVELQYFCQPIMPINWPDFHRRTSALFGISQLITFNIFWPWKSPKNAIHNIYVFIHRWANRFAHGLLIRVVLVFEAWQSLEYKIHFFEKKVVVNYYDCFFYSRKVKNTKLAQNNTWTCIHTCLQKILKKSITSLEVFYFSISLWNFDENKIKKLEFFENL